MALSFSMEMQDAAGSREKLEAVASSYPDRAEPLWELSCLGGLTPNEEFEYAWRAAQIPEPPSEVSDVRRDIYQWCALDKACITGFYAGRHEESVEAQRRLKERSNLIPAHYREHCLSNGNFSATILAGRQKGDNYHRTIRNLPTLHIGDTDVPNVFHVMWFKSYRTFSLIHYLCVLMIRETQNPMQIYIYNDEEPTDNEWWDRAKRVATVVKTDAPHVINDQDIPWIQHKADVARVLALSRGGVYVDADLLLTRPVAGLLHRGKVAMCHQDHYGLWNGFIACPEGHPFIAQWYETYKKEYGNHDKHNSWAGLSIRYPFTMKEEHPEWVAAHPVETFLPFGWYDDTIFNQTELLYEGSYGVHLWETETEKRGVLPKTVAWFEENRHICFAKMFGPYLFRREGRAW